MRTCRHCSCTETNACITIQGPCSWVDRGSVFTIEGEPDVCTACTIGGRNRRLTAKQLLVLQQLGAGLSRRGGAKALGIAPSTFSTVAALLARKFGVKSNAQLVALARDRGILPISGAPA